MVIDISDPPPPHPWIKELDRRPTIPSSFLILTMIQRGSKAGAAAIIGLCIIVCTFDLLSLKSPSSQDAGLPQLRRSLRWSDHHNRPPMNPLVRDHMKPLTTEPDPTRETGKKRIQQFFCISLPQHSNGMVKIGAILHHNGSSPILAYSKGECYPPCNSLMMHLYFHYIHSNTHLCCVVIAEWRNYSQDDI